MRFTKIEDDIILSKYKNKNIPIADICNELQRSAKSVQRRANKLGLNRVKYSINSNYFKQIDSWDKAYFLGLIYSDGNLHKHTNNVKISLQESDRSILEYLKNCISYEGNLLYKKPSIIKETGNFRKPQWTLSFTDKIIKRDLLDIGLLSNKSLVLTFPSKIPQSLYSAFLLGYFDGDGCIRVDKNNHLHFSLRGTLEFLEVVRDILCDNCQINPTKMTQDNPLKNNYRLEWRGNSSCIKIRDYLYKDALNFLYRKYEKFNHLKYSV